MNSDIFPVEIWHHIFSLACTDDGATGRSLSLVSTHFRDISAPFKYQSIAITHWSQIIAFSQIFCKLPVFQKKTLFLFVHHSLPFLDVNGYPLTKPRDQPSGESNIQEIRDELSLPKCSDEDGVLEAFDVESLFANDCDSESIPGSDDSWDQSDGVWDSEFEGSLDDDEEREILADAEYLKAVREKLLPHDGNTRDDILRDAEMQAVFDNILQAFHAVLNEISSTLQLLAVYWTSFKPLQIHELLPPLPRLVELHISRSSILKGYYNHENPPTTTLFPELLSLYISGGHPRKLSSSSDLARIAPNLASLRFSMSQLCRAVYGPEVPRHNFCFHKGGIIIESTNYQRHENLAAQVEKRLKWEFGKFKYAVKFCLVDVYRSDSPEIWQKWWTDQIVGSKDNELWTMFPGHTIEPDLTISEGYL